MAIAAIVIHTSPDSLASLASVLQAIPVVCDCQSVPPDRIAATVESRSDKLLEALQTIQNLKNIWNLELVYVNYEDDLDATGTVPCPPLEELQQKMKNK